ncbi:uncharacterized protein K444DRAFT_718701 [Hyaloscypha bicolor E]|uniref:C2H2-type domain-containing protein n=1 Tax=Hyaloscypha bicolor E TaxID=1095630 RepID=A0A2J6TG73_9HELO|nr:uncharacterized protein K444DRAFT_718701 [Hyaloscypha bicolor E]PMD62014.1 hypothetical protein K444DRAFT_718701 [Hyaloscypha bicolor E]
MPRQTRESTQRTKPVLGATPLTGGVSTSAAGSPAALGSLQSLEKSAAKSGTKHFRCDRCSRSFTRRENLCGICGKGFSRRDILSRHEAGHERWDQQNPSVSYSGGPRKRRRVAFGDDATSSTETVDPSPEVDEHEATEQDAWNQNQQQLVSPGFATLAGVSVHAAYQFNHSTGQQRTIVDQNSNSLPRISDARLPLKQPAFGQPVHDSWTPESFNLTRFDSDLRFRCDRGIASYSLLISEPFRILGAANLVA